MKKDYGNLSKQLCFAYILLYCQPGKVNIIQCGNKQNLCKRETKLFILIYINIFLLKTETVLHSISIGRGTYIYV